MAAIPDRRVVDPVLAKAMKDQLSNRPNLDFTWLDTKFVTAHDNGRPVVVTRASGTHGFEALLFKTAMHTDFDGAPKSYAPPASATKVGQQGGMIEKSLKNATDQKDPNPVFHDDNTLNTFTWTGVQSAKSGAMIDNRPFLKDKDGNFPKFRPGRDFYLPRTAMATADGLAVNAITVPYAALSTALRVHGGVDLGDVGIAIRMSTGASCGFLYGDAGGGNSTSVGEYSAKLMSVLFGGAPESPHSSDEDISVLVFPGSNNGPVAQPDLIPRLLAIRLAKLGLFENSDELVDRLANPHLGDNLFAGRRLIPQTGFRVSLQTAIADQDSIARAKVRAILRQWGAVGLGL